jgi:hypothetical protein
MWAATSLDSGRFDSIEAPSSIGALRSRLAALDARGAGYLEIRRVGTEFPVLTLGLRGSEAVVQAFSSTGDVATLHGPGSSTSEAIVIPVFDEEATFDSWAGVSLQAAWELVEAFLRGAALESLGTWVEL